MTYLNDELPYYSQVGWYTPMQLTKISVEVMSMDSGLASVISGLATIRGANDPNLEIKYMEFIQQFLRDNVPGFDDLIRQTKSPWN